MFVVLDWLEMPMFVVFVVLDWVERTVFVVLVILDWFLSGGPGDLPVIPGTISGAK